EDGRRLGHARSLAAHWRKGREEQEHWQRVRSRTARLEEGAQRLREAEGAHERIHRLKRLKRNSPDYRRRMEQCEGAVSHTYARDTAVHLAETLGEPMLRLRNL